MPRVAIYARFSSDHSRETSADDQIRVCRERALREGWDVVGDYADLAISGQDIRRPGMTAMLGDLAAGRFDIVLAEALDRIARDQEDSARIYKLVRFAGARMITLAQGEISELHIGLAGTMDALEVRKMADKIRRGARGSVSRGRVPAGVTYGYRATPVLKADGTVDRGLREIVPEQAEIVRRIFRHYVSGLSPRSIVQRLNADRIPAPAGGKWGSSTLTGSRARQHGILRNPLYVGRIVYGRVTMLRNPDSRKRVSRIAAADDLSTALVAELAIVDQATWDAAQLILEGRGRGPLQARPRMRRLLSGLVKCGRCDSSYVVISANRWGCAGERYKAICDNNWRIDGEELEERVVAVLTDQLMSPEAMAKAHRDYHVERAAIAREEGRARARIGQRLATLEREIANLVSALALGKAELPELVEAIGARRAEREALQAELAEIAAMPVISLFPEIQEAYRQRIEALARLVRQPGQEEAIVQIRSLIQCVTITPVAVRAENRRRSLPGDLSIDVLTSLQAAMDLAQPVPRAPRRGSISTVQVVAEEGLEPPTRGL